MIFRGKLLAPMMEEKQNCSILLKNQFAFFYSLSIGNRNVTPVATRKRTYQVEKTPPADKSFSVNMILVKIQGRKIGTQTFVNLKHYAGFNSNTFTFKKNLVLWLSNICRLLDLKTNLFFAIL